LAPVFRRRKRRCCPWSSDLRWCERATPYRFSPSAQNEDSSCVGSGKGYGAGGRGDEDAVMPGDHQLREAGMDGDEDAGVCRADDGLQVLGRGVAGDMDDLVAIAAEKAE